MCNMLFHDVLHSNGMIHEHSNNAKPIAHSHKHNKLPLPYMVDKKLHLLAFDAL